MSLGDGFSRRKQISAELETWINRLHVAGRDTIKFQTKEIEGENQFKPIPGSKKDFIRTYTIEECRKKIQELIEEDQKLALRISLTNQKAKSPDGNGFIQLIRATSRLKDKGSTGRQTMTMREMANSIRIRFNKFVTEFFDVAANA